MQGREVSCVDTVVTYCRRESPVKRFRPTLMSLAVATVSALLVSCTTSVSETVHRTLGNEASCSGPVGVTGALSAEGTVEDALVVTPDPYASFVACRILAEGGTAADAAVAAQFTLGLTEPQSSGPGGGAVAVYYDATTGDLRSWDGVVKAPSDDAGGTLTGIPQTPVLMATIHSDFGALVFEEVLAPAIELAEQGFTTSSRLASALERRQAGLDELPWPEAESGQLPDAGDTLTNPDYAGYLRGLDISDRIESEDALCVGYRGHDVCGSGSTGTGMMIVGEALGILDHVELEGESEDTVAHLVTEAERLALANGNTWMQDPAVDPTFSEAYVNSLVINQDHLMEQASRIDRDSSIGTIEPNPLFGMAGNYLPNPEEGTSQITVRDVRGSIASVTSTLHQHFGTREVQDGYFLNNSLKNFSSSAKAMNQRAPGVRPKTTMTPLIVFGNGEPVMALGTPGGGSIPSYVIKTIVGVVDQEKSLRSAIDAPNYGATGRNGAYHENDGGGSTSGLSALHIKDGVVTAEADPRADGAARSTKTSGF